MGLSYRYETFLKSKNCLVKHKSSSPEDDYSTTEWLKLHDLYQVLGKGSEDKQHTQVTDGSHGPKLNLVSLV